MPDSPRDERSSTLSQSLLDPLLNRDPVGPRITYYDDATGERIELSTVTLANWAAKTANLLRDELGAGPGSRIAVLLPAHWQTAAVLLGVWYIGAEVVLGPGEADVALCTADRIDDADAAVGQGEIAVLSLDPFGKPVAALPIGVTDYATSVRVHGDQIVVRRAVQSVTLLHPVGYNYYATLRQKLHWHEFPSAEDNRLWAGYPAMLT